MFDPSGQGPLDTPHIGYSDPLLGGLRGLLWSCSRRAWSAAVAAWHEIRDPVHNFITVSTYERRVIDSPPVQRLRHIHQLALSYLVYPGATHKRFEHSLGVMHLAGEAFDVVTATANLTDEVRAVIPEINETQNLPYWRTVVRMAALCHDLGHLPFSHAAEHELLPAGYSHERLSADLIMSPEFAELLLSLVPPIPPQLLSKLSVGPAKAKAETFSTWEAILSEIVVGDAFGVDRMDYLLRDSLHAGVQYGTFDHYRLLNTLRILPQPPAESDEPSEEPSLGVTEGGLHAAESLLLARYFMWTQVYFHPVRLMYDAHLQDFLAEWLEGGQFSTDLDAHLAMTDLEVLTAMRDAINNPGEPGSEAAGRILRRGHFRRVYSRTPGDQELALEPGAAIGAALSERYGTENVKSKKNAGSSGGVEFPVKMYDGSIVSSTSFSDTLRTLPKIFLDQVFVEPSRAEDARDWLDAEKESILRGATD